MSAWAAVDKPAITVKKPVVTGTLKANAIAIVPRPTYFICPSLNSCMPAQNQTLCLLGILLLLLTDAKTDPGDDPEVNTAAPPHSGDE
jgi:hypothetical protein